MRALAQRHGAAILSGMAAFAFFTLVWHATVFREAGMAVGLGAFMGLVVLGAFWNLPAATHRDGREHGRRYR
jgi:hypothetical protein